MRADSQEKQERALRNRVTISLFVCTCTILHHIVPLVASITCLSSDLLDSTTQHITAQGRIEVRADSPKKAGEGTYKENKNFCMRAHYNTAHHTTAQGRTQVRADSPKRAGEGTYKESDNLCACVYHIASYCTI
eukprot:15325045-Ditylum_brightwellii.AAC.1